MVQDNILVGHGNPRCQQVANGADLPPTFLEAAVRGGVDSNLATLKSILETTSDASLAASQLGSC